MFHNTNCFITSNVSGLTAIQELEVERTSLANEGRLCNKGKTNCHSEQLNTSLKKLRLALYLLNYEGPLCYCGIVGNFS